MTSIFIIRDISINNFKFIFCTFIIFAFCSGGKSFGNNIVFSDCDTCPQMVVIEKGNFKMGSPPSDLGRPATEGAVRDVSIPEPFALGLYEITYRQWEFCALAGACRTIKYPPSSNKDHPVVNVSWSDTAQYTKWLIYKTGFKYRLPTEEEWEYAARAGSDRSRFFGMDKIMVCKFGNVFDKKAKLALGYEWEHLPCFDGFIETAPVGSFRANTFGLFDMIGNVWEWTGGCANLSTRGIRTNSPTNAKNDCSQRAVRGGSWLSHPPKYIRFSDRYKYFKVRDRDLGFRVVRELVNGDKAER